MRRRLHFAAGKLVGYTTGVPLRFFVIDDFKMFFLRLLVKGGNVLKNVIAASGAYRALLCQGVTADRAIVICVLFQGRDGC